MIWLMQKSISRSTLHFGVVKRGAHCRSPEHTSRDPSVVDCASTTKLNLCMISLCVISERETLAGAPSAAAPLQPAPRCISPPLSTFVSAARWVFSSLRSCPFLLFFSPPSSDFPPSDSCAGASGVLAPPAHWPHQTRLSGGWGWE